MIKYESELRRLAAGQVDVYEIISWFLTAIVAGKDEGARHHLGWRVLAYLVDGSLRSETEPDLRL
jgi:hypothetical protein